ncbi:MAG TPA: hypothetical protein VMV22_03470 [Acidimicrobiales bacterium]|nr:hypothetical protein [Acidimicrobiales bacterium]
MASLDTELDRLLAPHYLDGVNTRSLEEVRAMRAECQAAETAVSFLRRLAQGRLDLVHACLDRAEGESGGLDSLVERLPSIIGSGPARPSGYGRLPSQMSPDLDSTDLTEEIDGVLDADHIGALPTMGDDELRAVGDRLTEIETRISDQRRALHERIDTLQAEIVSRYKTGEASVDGLLA